MNETPNDFLQAGVPVCARCGERPGRVRLVFANGASRGEATLCEVCAQAVMANQGGDLSAAAPAAPQRKRSQTPALDEFGRDLTADAAAGAIDPVIGREDEIAETIEILARRRKNNAVLIGEPGVGKTAIAEGLALRVVSGDVPATLHNARIIAVDLSGMIAGAQFRGQFEQRFKSALQEAADADNVVLFLDELHTILGAGNAEGAMDAANMLKPLLARGELRVIGATTLSEYRAIERDGALSRRFSAVMVDEPSVEETVAILRGLRRSYEEHHGAVIEDAALEAAARLSDRYVSEYHLPDKAIDLIDQAAARMRLRSGGGEDEVERVRERLTELRAHKQAAIDAEEYEDAGRIKSEIETLGEQLETLKASGAGSQAIVGESEVAAVVAARTGIPIGELVEAETARLQDLEADLHQRVIGQDAAVESVSDTIRRARVGLSEGDRPLGSFLFLGPTGVGKTELVKALAERLFATEKALVRIDMSEFREPHTVARLIGSPPGYVGYGEGGQLTEPVRRRPYSVILLDEVEKAHPDVWNVLLQVMDDGRLTDGEGRTVDFTNTVLVMTSNLGAGQARRSVGFTAGEPAADEERMVAAAKSAFLPEFVNRIDEIVTFRSLTREQVEEIAGLVVSRVAERLHAERGIELVVEPELITQFARDGFDEQFGARPLQRHVRRTLEKALTRAILAGELPDGSRVVASQGDGPQDVVLQVVAELAPVAA